MSTLVHRFRVRCGLLGSQAGKGWLLLFGRMFTSDTKNQYRELLKGFGPVS